MAYEGISKTRLDSVRGWVRDHVGKACIVTCENEAKIKGLTCTTDEFGNLTLKSGCDTMIILRCNMRRIQYDPEGDKEWSMI